jgi:hypothetical protein
MSKAWQKPGTVEHEQAYPYGCPNECEACDKRFGTRQGTAWTEPGQGATLQGLWDALPSAKSSSEYRSVPRRRLGKLALSPGTSSGTWSHRTNLLLTGAPLTAEDVKRIAKCEVK